MAQLINGHPFDANLFSGTGEVPLVRIRDLTAPYFETFVARADIPEVAIIRNNDVLIGMDGDFNVELWRRGLAALNQRVCLLRASNGADPRFIAYALPPSLKEINDLTYSTTVKHLSSRDVLGIRLQAPPLGEQQAIADYLDRETQRIDELIAEQRGLIETLRERRNAAFTKLTWGGLDASAPLAKSGIESAPLAPSHWKRSRNKQIFFESKDVSAGGTEELLTVSHLTGITPRSEKNVTMIEAKSLEGYRNVEPADLVINTMWAWMGALGVSQVSGIVSPAYGVYRPINASTIEPGYFNHLVRSSPYITEMTRNSRGVWSSRLRLYPDVFLRMPIVVPPLNEQRTIADTLDDQTSRIDALIAESEDLIALSLERRAALITAAVTGQIDVRTAA